MTSLRTKFIVFISVIIIVVCSGLSWYVVTEQVEFMADALRKTGLVIVKNLAYNSRFPLIAKDTVSLERLTNGAMKIDEVAYVVMTDSKGSRLVSKGKETVQTGDHPHLPNLPRFPEGHSRQSAINMADAEPIITPFKGNVQKNMPPDTSSAWNLPFINRGHLVYDFALPVLQRKTSNPLLGPLVLEQQENTIGSLSQDGSQHLVHGIVHVGISNEKMIRQLNDIVWKIVLITILIIASGIAATALLANRIINPLRNLAEVAKQVSTGDFSVSVTPTTQDEVGELSKTFNTMTQAIREREQAISSQVATITKHANKLTTLNQTGSAIASYLDLNTLLSAVLQLLVEKVGFTHMLLMLYDRERGIAYGAQTAGIPNDLASQIHSLDIPIHDNDSILADLVLRGKAFVVPEIEPVHTRLPQEVLPLIRKLGIASFVCAPLKSQQHIMGFIAADSTPLPCTQEDLDLLMTIANTVGVAIDNAKAYQQLEQLNITLEQRVQDRTHELTKANVKLQELDQLKSAFVTIVSHELRTPMTSVKGLVENMLDGVTGKLTERQTFYLSRVQANIERLTRMINDLLDLSRIEAGRMDLIPASLSIPDLITEVIENLQEMATEHDLTIRVIQPGSIPLIRGDRDKLSQVFTNLVHNAIKFTPPSGSIEIRANSKDDHWIEVCVTDTGCGIPQEELQTIFERFYRSSTGPHASRGAGLGLAITKSLVELHGGQIRVDSTLGKGTNFLVTLPIEGPVQ